MLAAYSQEERTRVAVLPFAYAGGGPDDEYLADGMTEEMIEWLSQVKQPRVIARTSVMGYKKKDKKKALLAGSPWSYEAANLSTVAATHFIPLANRSSLRFSLGAWAWENALPPPMATHGASKRYIGPVPADDTVTTGAVE